MKQRFALFSVLLVTPLAVFAQRTPTPADDGLCGDGVRDDTAAIQALLDARTTLVYLPAPPRHYLISKPLRIHSNQTLQLDPFTVIRLQDRSDCLMITNDDHGRGNENIALVGGVWDMNNENQSPAEYQKTRNWKGEYDPARYLGVLMRFNRVKRLTLRGLTLKDTKNNSVILVRSTPSNTWNEIARRRHVSRDEAKTWLGPYRIDTVGGAYPATVELKDGSLLVVYYEEGGGSAVRVRRFRLGEEGLESLAWD